MADGGGARRRRRHLPDEQRLVERVTRLAPQQKALLLALGPFLNDDGQFDRARWSRAFDSDDPQTIVSVKAVTGLYEGLVNHLVEMLFVAARLRGLDVVRRDIRPTGPELFRAVAKDGGLTSSQAEVLLRLYAMRNELQHSSPGVEAGDVYDEVLLLTRTLRRFVKRYIEWLRDNGITLV